MPNMTKQHPDSSPMLHEVALDLDYPECPYWSVRDECLYFVEWTGDRISRLVGERVEPVFTVPTASGPCGICQDDGGNFWVCLYSACRLVHYSPQGDQLQSVEQVETTRLKGPNDLVMAPDGSLYFTDSGDFADDWVTGRPAGAVYHRQPGGELARVASQICYANGIALSADGRYLYVNEHRQNRVLRIARLPSGEFSPPEVFHPLDRDVRLEQDLAYELGPDGMCLDGQGRIWIAHFGGGKVVALSPTGQLIHKVFLPRGNRPTNLAYRPDTNCLYITEAEFGLLYVLHLDKLDPNTAA